MPYQEKLKDNSKIGIENSHNYQNLMKEIKKKDESDPDHAENFGQNDLQLEEANNLMKDLLMIERAKHPDGPRQNRKPLR